jgi:hypothetical protein
MPDLLKPKLKIVELSEVFDEERLRACIQQQNLRFSNFVIKHWKLIVCKKIRNNYLAIVEVEAGTFNEFMKTNTIYVNWNDCKLLSPGTGCVPVWSGQLSPNQSQFP